MFEKYCNSANYFVSQWHFRQHFNVICIEASQIKRLNVVEEIKRDRAY